MKKLGIILFVLILGACAPTTVAEFAMKVDDSSLQQECRELEDKKVEAVYIKWGTPLEIQDTGDYKVLIYKDYVQVKNMMTEIRHDVFVRSGVIKICKVRLSHKRLY